MTTTEYEGINMNISNIKAAMADFERELADLSKELNVVATTKSSVKYNDYSFTVKVEISEVVAPQDRLKVEPITPSNKKVWEINDFSPCHLNFYNNIAKSKYREHKAIQAFIGTSYDLSDGTKCVVVGLTSTRSNANVAVAQINSTNVYVVKLNKFVG